MNWEIVIGLETHAQLSTESKIFSGTSTAFGREPNKQASAIDMALPGTLPVLNKGAVEHAIRFGLAVGGKINQRSIFERKNYFYPDLPKGYQISQYQIPIVQGGSISIRVGEEEKRVRLTRAHLEEDAGKSLHEDFHGMSGIDLNRAGVPLLEIVSEPDMRSPEEAVAYAKALHELVVALGICDGNMQEGSFRCDANVSVRRPGGALGTRREIKNLNSFRFLQQAIEFEAGWQIKTLEDGGRIEQATVLFDPDSGQTRMMRSKEEAHDYRYFPDPDLLPLEVSEEWIRQVQANQPELPGDKRQRYVREFGLSEYDAANLTVSRGTSDFFERTVATVEAGSITAIAKQAANLITVDLASYLNRENMTIESSSIRPEDIRSLARSLAAGTISSRIKKEVLDAMWVGEGGPDEIIEKRGLKQISDAGAIEPIIDLVLADNPQQVADYRSGKEKAFNSLVGQVMKKTGGKANPAQVNEILRRKLSR
jgi:aspartyl-tRNA(Asn)/glutamyl-tRNA(Gln) amidotransferase subunit B